jgi:hypothetical protein
MDEFDMMQESILWPWIDDPPMEDMDDETYEENDNE